MRHHRKCKRLIRNVCSVLLLTLSFKPFSTIVYKLCTSSFDAISVLIVDVVVSASCDSLLFIKEKINFFMESTTIFMFHLSINHQSIWFLSHYSFIRNVVVVGFNKLFAYSLWIVIHFIVLFCFSLFVWSLFEIRLFVTVLYLWLLIIHFFIGKKMKRNYLQIVRTLSHIFETNAYLLVRK